jgi:deoxyribodipyrimidine photo-lyase
MPSSLRDAADLESGLSPVTSPVPDLRVRTVNGRPPDPAGSYVLYWMIAQRRVPWNFALQHAVAWAERLGRPLVVFEPLRVGYPWASDRLHTFVLQGMLDNAEALAASGATYYPYVEPGVGAGKGLLAALAARAAVVVTDEYPAFFLRRMVAAAGEQVRVRLDAVDSNGLLPLASTDRTFATAFAFRAFLQRTLLPHLAAFPLANPLSAAALPPPVPAPAEVVARWPPLSTDDLGAPERIVARLPVDHGVAAAPLRGGAGAGGRTLRSFLEERLGRYADARNQPEDEVASGLSPYLHFGHISVHEVFSALMTRERWTTRRLGARASGKREGWWGASPAAEAFLDQLVTWREVGFNMCHLTRDHDQYDSLPRWARETLGAHAGDPREHVYPLESFEHGRTHDPLWNAAQTQLVREGRIHNYLRMLWGKKILEWTRSPQDALAVMIELNNKYALDGRDPNSYTGIFWVLGRYDRPWAPERPVFGTVRYMSSENTARKLRVKGYVAKYAPGAQGRLGL